MRTEQQVILEMTREAHSLVLFYLKQLNGTDVKRIYTSNGIELNSTYWISGHLCCIADWIFFTGTAKMNSNKPSWLAQFGLGTNPKHVTEMPPFEEIINYLNDIYKRAYELIEHLSDEELQSDNHCDISFGGDKSIRKLLFHQIRHEASHAGNLAWLCKLNGIKIV